MQNQTNIKYSSNPNVFLNQLKKVKKNLTLESTP